MLLPVCLYLSGNLLFLCFRVFGSGALLGVHALHHLDDTIPCLLAVYNSLGFEHNGLVFNRGFRISPTAMCRASRSSVGMVT